MGARGQGGFTPAVKGDPCQRCLTVVSCKDPGQWEIHMAILAAK